LKEKKTTVTEKKTTLRTTRTRRITEINIEREDFLLIRQMDIQRGWCDLCCAVTRQATVKAAAAISQVTAGTIYQWVEMDQLHFAHAGRGKLLICLNALRQFCG
jgi:hypothetical protein